MSMLFGRKTAGITLGTINYARGLVISLYLVSWTFSFVATMLVQTNDFDIISCTLSVFSCIFLYALSKIIIYLFLMEKVYVVTAVGLTRKDFGLYKVNMILMLPYLGILSLMIIFRVSNLDNDGNCYIGIYKPASLPLIFYDVFLSCWLTALFIRPLMSSTSFLQGPSKGRLRDVARRTLIGCIIALFLSSANIFTLAYFDGHERGWICLTSCIADVTLNAITIHWVTSRGGGPSSGGDGRGSWERRGGSGAGGRGLANANSGYSQTIPEKQVAPMGSHISITVESCMEDYQRLHNGHRGGESSGSGHSDPVAAVADIGESSSMPRY
ncbi:hypothetical protein BG011_004272 [Mortierella polycephala]|uniref:Transmembrane protein n=1 Tax=Mortierella polycephala TaxID=41804 RepID=A0A9P6QEU3_9FUNG|nr:hypothetical protein BG011_004272 [Mortierella polycephala]